MVAALLTALGTGSCFNEDGNCRGDPTNVELIDRAGAPNWRASCGDTHNRWKLAGVVGRVPRDGRILEVLTCDTLLVQVRGRCFLVTQGHSSHSWSQALCPTDERK